MKTKRLFLTWAASLGLLSAPSAGAIPLGEALDNTNLVWTTGGNALWDGTNNITFDGVDAAVSGKITHNQSSWLQTTVLGPGQLSFWWKVESDPPDGIEFRIDDVFQDGKSGNSAPAYDWTYKTVAIPAGSHTLKWQYLKDGAFNFGMDRGWVDRVKFLTGTQPSLEEALNTCGVTWTSGGNTNPTYWIAQTNVTFDGVMAAESGDIYDGQTNWIETTVTGVTNVSFRWKVSSEAGFDVLEFYRGSTQLATYSGEQPWQLKSFSIPAGTHTLRWSYGKDYSSRAGQDHAWLDQVVLSPSPPCAFSCLLTNPLALPDRRFQMTVVGTAGGTCRIQFSTNLALTNWATLTNLATTGAGVPITDSGASNSAQRFYRAVAP